jgi:predicted metal-binding membrane protein
MVFVPAVALSFLAVFFAGAFLVYSDFAFLAMARKSDLLRRLNYKVEEYTELAAIIGGVTAVIFLLFSYFDIDNGSIRFGLG